MDYRANLKQLLMRGQMFKLKGQGIAGRGPFMDSHIYKKLGPMPPKDYSAGRGSGTISHRAAVDRAIDSMNDLNITGQGARKKDYTAPKAKKSKGSGNFKSLKFNF
jgi:hypothetical protein